MPAGPRTHSGYIGYHHERIGRSLDEHSLRIRTAGCFEAIEVIGVHIGGADAVLGENPFQQPVGAAVQIQ
ncbi:hypothetical protein D3C73_1436310 [compost metagenome]